MSEPPSLVPPRRRRWWRWLLLSLLLIVLSPVGYFFYTGYAAEPAPVATIADQP
jgi:hypothetical protein